MKKVYLPDSFANERIYGAPVQEDEGGKFVEVGEPYDQMLVAQHGGQLAEAPAVEAVPDPAGGTKA